MFAGKASHFGFGLSQSTFESVDIEETLDGGVLAPSRGHPVDMMKIEAFVKKDRIEMYRYCEEKKEKKRENVSFHLFDCHLK